MFLRRMGCVFEEEDAVVEILDRLVNVQGLVGRVLRDRGCVI